MSDMYTPKTPMVKSEYITGVVASGNHTDLKEIGKEFDRWLTAEIAQAVEVGRALQRGLDESRRGDVVELGDFTKYIEDEERRTTAWEKYRAVHGRTTVPAFGDSHYEFDNG